VTVAASVQAAQMPPKARGASVWGQWIRKVRNDHARLNQTDFGEKIGRSKGTITDWERGENDPEMESVAAILKAFPGCPPPPLPLPEGAEGLTGRSGTVSPDSPHRGGYVVHTSYQGRALAEFVDQLPVKLRTEAMRLARDLASWTPCHSTQARTPPTRATKKIAP
jgi:DNA-binding XRE family transcriptional regulator